MKTPRIVVDFVSYDFYCSVLLSSLLQISHFYGFSFKRN